MVDLGRLEIRRGGEGDRSDRGHRVSTVGGRVVGPSLPLKELPTSDQELGSELGLQLSVVVFALRHYKRLRRNRLGVVHGYVTNLVSDGECYRDNTFSHSLSKVPYPEPDFEFPTPSLSPFSVNPRSSLRHVPVPVNFRTHQKFFVPVKGFVGGTRPEVGPSE